MKLSTYPILFLATLLAQSALAEPFFGPGGGALEKMHSAFLSGDLKTMTLAMKQSLAESPRDRQIQQNVFALLRKAYELHPKDIGPSDWHLPDEINKLKVTVRLLQGDSRDYRLNVSGNMAGLGTIKQLVVKRFPDEVVIDKSGGVGEWEEGLGHYDETPEYTARSKRTRVPPGTGLYLLDLELANGKVTRGWFIVDDGMIPTAAPVIVSPAEDQTVHTANPVLQVPDFRTPQFDPACERRGEWVGVNRVEPPAYDWNLVWDTYSDGGEMPEVAVGSGGYGAQNLENGRYTAVASFTERRRFGDIWIGREASVHRTFYVKH